MADWIKRKYNSRAGHCFRKYFPNGNEAIVACVTGKNVTRWSVSTDDKTIRQGAVYGCSWLSIAVAKGHVDGVFIAMRNCAIAVAIVVAVIIATK